MACVAVSVATFRSYTTELTVPGGAVRADAVTNVTVAPASNADFQDAPRNRV